MLNGPLVRALRAPLGIRIFFFSTNVCVPCLAAPQAALFCIVMSSYGSNIAYITFIKDNLSKFFPHSGLSQVPTFAPYLVLCNAGIMRPCVCLRPGTGSLRRNGHDRSEPVIMRSQSQQKYPELPLLIFYIVQMAWIGITTLPVLGQYQHTLLPNPLPT